MTEKTLISTLMKWDLLVLLNHWYDNSINVKFVYEDFEQDI